MDDSEDEQVSLVEFNWDEQTNSKGQTAKQLLLKWLTTGENMEDCLVGRYWPEELEMADCMDKYLAKNGIQGCTPRFIRMEIKLTIAKYIKAKDQLACNIDSSEDDSSEDEDGISAKLDESQKGKFVPQFFLKTGFHRH